MVARERSLWEQRLVSRAGLERVSRVLGSAFGPALGIYVSERITEVRIYTSLVVP
jgi:hypothetical protein